ncbi:hypothetical protein LCGC14_1048130 [marine sediment metagenome]|uniref:Uncharacterized protein n=1 Tax=marine sediment metagenome TaxID=412755 RepID=A0A0F9NBI3_9ZZZZ
MDKNPILKIKNVISKLLNSPNKILQDTGKRVKEEKEQEEKPVPHYSRMHHRHSRR